jgi:choice-of-anchor C domain-containing protein
MSLFLWPACLPTVTAAVIVPLAVSFLLFVFGGHTGGAMSVSIERSGVVLAALAAIFGCLAAVAVAQPLVTNRSFESGTDPGDAMVLSPGSRAVDGWTVADGDVSYVGRRWQHGEGARSVALLCGSAITQTIGTEPEQTYEVRFTMAGDPDASPSLKTVAVSLGEETRMFTFDTAGRSRKDMGWASRTWVFKASEKISTLTFRSPRAQCSVPAVDNVRVDPVAICVQTHPGTCSRRHWNSDAVGTIPTARLRAALAFAFAAHPVGEHAPLWIAL